MKITLAEKIVRATARCMDTYRHIEHLTYQALPNAQWQYPHAVAEVSWLVHQAQQAPLSIRRRLQREALDKASHLEEKRIVLEYYKAQLRQEKKRLANQRAYLRKLKAEQAAIDAEEADIEQLITLAGAIA